MGRELRNNVFDDIFKKLDIEKEQFEQYEEPEYEDNKSDSNSKYVRIIAIDETGRFEDLWDPDSYDFRCIGGIYKDIPIPDDSNTDEVIKRELNLIHEFLYRSTESYNKGSTDLKVKMPESLHGSDCYILDTNGDKIINNVALRNGNLDKHKYIGFKNRFNRFIEDEAEKFLEDHGYHIFAYILSKNQLEPLFETEKIESNVVDYRVGANLYQDMVMKAINNLLFYDFKEHIDNAYIYLATRSIDNNQVSQNETLYDHNEPKSRLYITNTNYVKASLMHKVNNGDIPVKDIHIGLDVESIDYSNRNKLNESNWKDKQINLSMLYMADIVCGVLKSKFGFGENGILKNDFNRSRCEEALISTSYDLIDNGFDIRFISEPDKMLNKMIEQYYEGNLVDYYSIKYDFLRRIVSKKESISRLSVFYLNQLVTYLDEKLEKRILEDADYSENIISRLPQYYSDNNGFMGTVENKYEKGLFVALCMCKILEHIKAKIHSAKYYDKYVFGFNDIVVRGYNHRGDISVINEYLKKCDDSCYAVGIEEYLEHKQRAVQKYFNALDYDYIINDYYRNVIGSFIDGRWNLSNIENLKSSMALISGKKNQGYLLIGKIYSSLAQALAFKRSGTAELYFSRAMEEMEDDLGNINITRSYLMHHYCDMGMVSDNKLETYKDKFEKEAILYFDLDEKEIDKECLEKIFENIMRLIPKRSELRFALYLYIKALRAFYVPKYIEDSRFKKFIRKASKEILEYSDTINNLIHPWELIYINMYKVLAELGCDEKDQYVNRVINSDRINNNGPTIAAIIKKFEIDISGENKDIDFDKSKLMGICGFEHIEDMTDLEIKDTLNRKLTYMYE